MVFPHFTLPLLQALPSEGFAMPHHVTHRARILQSKVARHGSRFGRINSTRQAHQRNFPTA